MKKFSMLSAVLMLLFFSACKKDNTTGSGLQNCYCIKQASGTDTTRYTRNSDGKITLVQSPLQQYFKYIRYTYYSDHFIADRYYSYDSTNHYYTIYYLNTAGYIARSNDSVPGSASDHIVYQYDANGYMTQKSEGLGNPAVTVYTWANGNLASYVTTGASTGSGSYEYYTDHVYHGTGKDFMEKYYGKMNANPIKRADIIAGGPVMTSLYGYTFDGNDNILEEQIINPDGGVSTYDYILQCN